MEQEQRIYGFIFDVYSFIIANRTAKPDRFEWLQMHEGGFSSSSMKMIVYFDITDKI